MQIKLLVYRVTRIETIDVFYDGMGGYADLELQLRPIIVEADQTAATVLDSRQDSRE